MLQVQELENRVAAALRAAYDRSARIKAGIFALCPNSEPYGFALSLQELEDTIESGKAEIAKRERI